MRDRHLSVMSINDTPPTGDPENRQLKASHLAKRIGIAKCLEAENRHPQRVRNAPDILASPIVTDFDALGALPGEYR